MCDEEDNMQVWGSRIRKKVTDNVTKSFERQYKQPLIIINPIQNH